MSRAVAARKNVVSHKGSPLAFKNSTRPITMLTACPVGSMSSGIDWSVVAQPADANPWRVLTLKAKEDERGEHQRASALSHKGSPGDSCDAPRLRVTGDTDPRLAVWYKNGMRFTCIYCLRSQPDVTPSEAHIVPFVMGGSTSTRDTVCLACNSHVNRRVEMRVLDSFLVFQSIFGIRGRRNTIRRVHGVLETEDLKANVSLNEHREITEAA